MIRNGVSYYQFEALTHFRGIDHGVFTRNSGYSQSPFASLNVSYGIGDEKKAVARNREFIARVMGAGTMTYIDQVHRTDNYLVIHVADCQSVLMYEPTRQVVANVHSGWRGSILNIVGRTVETMKRHFGCRPDGIHAAIGPSLGPCCAEFVNYQTEIPREFWSYRGPGNLFDFWAISSDQLIAAGVLAENIESSQMCTRCRTEDFFSYRDGKTTGRFAAVIGIKN